MYCEMDTVIKLISIPSPDIVTMLCLCVYVLRILEIYSVSKF